MCGIVGLFLKNSKLESELGRYLAEMLVTMSDRGPDSAGLALYSKQSTFDMKLTLKLGKSQRFERNKGKGGSEETTGSTSSCLKNYMEQTRFQLPSIY